MLVYCLSYSSTLKMKATYSSESSVDFQWTTGCCRIWGFHSGSYEEYHLLGIMPCSPLSVNRCFGETYLLHLQGRKNKFKMLYPRKQNSSRNRFVLAINWKVQRGMENTYSPSLSTHFESCHVSFEASYGMMVKLYYFSPWSILMIIWIRLTASKEKWHDDCKQDAEDGFMTCFKVLSWL
jgi:hypothetical protein